MNRLVGCAALACVSALFSHVPEARACGCFTPPDPTLPVVQAGERIVFAVKQDTVTMHVQIQYQGEANQFGWLLPLPSLPTLQLGTEELFNEIVKRTQPTWTLERKYADGCQKLSFGCGFAASPTAYDRGGAEGGPADMGSPLVVQDSIGPYDYAVLKAESKDDMLKWLADNRYFVPVGTDTVVSQYLHPGAYFLALKLKSGKSAGDIQPVVVRYTSDLPMVPIVLTSVTAVPDMAIQIFMLGAGRAIPRNYSHVVVDDAALDWAGGLRNYVQVLNRAVGEAPDKHGFVTEYAGTSALMRDVLDPIGRFGSVDALRKETDPIKFVEYLVNNGYGAYPFTGLLRNLLGSQSFFPEPPELVAEGVSRDDYYAKPDYYLARWKERYPNAPPVTFDLAGLAAELDERIVKPTRDAGRLFRDNAYLTRLYTALSPRDMNLDPVFSFNPELPEVGREHKAVIQYDCDLNGVLTTEEGFELKFPRSAVAPAPPAVPYALRIERLREAGAPEVQTDNVHEIKAALGQADSTGCRVDAGPRSRTPRGPLLPLVVAASLALALALRLARRRA